MNRPAHIADMDDDDDLMEAGIGGDRYFNRELSWLAFNRRVLEEATNAAHPLLERLRFLSISASNLDEFFMVRVAGLKGQQLQEVERQSVDGLTPGQQLAMTTHEADRLMASQHEVWHALRALLADAGISLLEVEEIAGDDADWLENHFRDQIFPILTPQALDPAHPFPFIPNKGSSLIFDLVRLSDKQPIRELVMLPNRVGRFVRLPGDTARYVTIETLIRRFSVLLFPGYQVEAAASFRVLRDSDLEIEEDAEDLVRYFANAIKRRRRGRVIRLELEGCMPAELESLLKAELGGTEALITECGGFLGLGDLDRLG